jgi:glyoxylase-like metal-dependent hydrolase (beta-lactamase superfamily II)
VEAGQAYRWDGEHWIGDTLRLALAPGHTPGSSVLWLEGGNGAVFIGDLMHTPVQIARPDDACAFDLDVDTARTTRRALLSAAAHSHIMLFPAHFAGHGALTIDVNGTEGFDIGEWAEFGTL